MVNGRKISPRMIFDSMMLWNWNLAECLFTVLCLHSKRKILILSNTGRKIPNLRKKVCYRKSLSFRKKSYVMKKISYVITLKNSQSNFYFDKRASLEWYILTKLYSKHTGQKVFQNCQGHQLIQFLSSLFKIQQKPCHGA